MHPDVHSRQRKQTLIRALSDPLATPFTSSAAPWQSHYDGSLWDGSLHLRQCWRCNKHCTAHKSAGHNVWERTTWMDWDMRIHAMTKPQPMTWLDIASSWMLPPQPSTISQGDTKGDMHWDLVAELNVCLSKYPADDHFMWHFAELTICLPQGLLACLLYITLAAWVWDGATIARLLSTFEFWKTKVCAESYNLFYVLSLEFLLQVQFYFSWNTF